MRFERYECYKDSGVEWLGEIPCEWEIKRNKDISKIVDCKNRTPEIFDNQKYFVVRTTNVKNGKLNFNKATYTNKKNFIEWTKRGTPKENSILFTREAPLGEVCLVPKDIDLCLGQRMMNFTIKKNSYKYILYYLLSDNFQNYLKVIGSGSTVKHLRVFQVYDFHIAIPPLKTQQKIATYLDTQTQKIEKEINLLEQKIEKYKELKQTLINETVLRGLDKGVELKDSGIEWIGEIPKSWEIKRLKETYKIFKKIVGENSKNFNLLSLTQNGVISRDINSGIGKFPAEFNTYQIIENNDLIFCLFDMDVTPRTIGISPMNGMITGAYTVIKTKKQVFNKYYYYLFLSADIYKKLSPYYTGLRNTIKKEKFLSLGVPHPCYEEQIQIANYLDEKTQKIDNITQTISKKIELLKEFRKTLVNDVVTGRVKVE